MLRLVNGTLLLLALAGAFVSVRAGLEFQGLRAEHRSMMAEVGLLSVSEPDKAHFVAIDTGDPLHFAWQVYMPANFDVRWQMRYTAGSGVGGSSGDTKPYFDLVQVRVRKEAKSGATVWIKQRGGSRQLGLDSRELARFEGGQLRIEQLGAVGSVAVDRLQVVTLLRLAESDAPDQRPLVEIHFGTPQAFQALKAPLQR